jgi:hypothetical protein
MGPEPIPFDYGKFLKNYWIVIYHFVDMFLAKIPRGDQTISNWATECAHFIPGFPDGIEIWRDDNLKRAITTYIYTVSVAHSCDHYDYSQGNINQMPLRIRIEPPSSKNRRTEWSYQSIFKKMDIFRHKMAKEMYFKANTISHLIDIKYHCLTKNEKEASLSFKEHLISAQTNYDGKIFIPLSQIATSIQF